MSDVMYQFDNLYLLYCKYKRNEPFLKSELIKYLRRGHKLNEDYLPLEEFMWFMADCIEDKPVFRHTHNSKGLTLFEAGLLAGFIANYRLEGVRGEKTKAIEDMARRKNCTTRAINSYIKQMKEDGEFDVYDVAQQLYEHWSQQKNN
ncbi:hypothetical protein [Methylophaga sp.]|uniref:hypothetical protein n=1 Tax=Methylophaga sp. TaxID=2024840 RepID=UPI0013FED5A5|nr:hypothetical protein [Methylophaga sp.]MTI64394.1 hypothetical protein [Methylophaga sp.]